MIEYRLAFYEPNGSGGDTLGFSEIPSGYASEAITPLIHNLKIFLSEDGMNSLTFTINHDDSVVGPVVRGRNFIVGLELREGDGAWKEAKNGRFVIDKVVDENEHNFITFRMVSLNYVLAKIPTPVNSVISSMSLTNEYTAIDTIFVNDTESLQDVIIEAVTASKALGLPEFMSTVVDASAAVYAPFEVSVDSSLLNFIRSLQQYSRFEFYWDAFTLKIVDVESSVKGAPFFFSTDFKSFGTATVRSLDETIFGGPSSVTSYYNTSDTAYATREDDSDRTDFYLTKYTAPVRLMGLKSVKNNSVAGAINSKLKSSIQPPFMNKCKRFINFSASDFLPILNYDINSIYAVEVGDDFVNLRCSIIYMESSSQGLHGVVELRDFYDTHNNLENFRARQMIL